MGILGNVYRFCRFKVFSITKVQFKHFNLYISPSSQFHTDSDCSIIFEGNAIINRNVFIDIHQAAKCIIKNNVYIGDSTIIRCSRSIVEIGEDTIIGQCVKFLGTNHKFVSRDELIRNQDIDLEKNGITLGKDCWIGSGVIILAGIKIGNGVVVAAGSVVTKNIADYEVVAGNPARFIKMRGE